MSHTDLSGGVWPPHGWEQFKDIELLSDQIIHKDPISAQVTGLCYKIEPIPVFKKQSRTYVYNISIESWEYSIHNESREVSVLSFLLGEAKPMPMARELVVENIKAFSRPIHTTAKSSHRALTAALSLMRQINNDQMPQIEKILKLYKLHPTQKQKISVQKHNVRKQKQVSDFGKVVGKSEEKRG